MLPRRGRAVAALALVFAADCAGPPTPTEAARRIARNPKATVTGVVLDEKGRPVPDVHVQAIPGGDTRWSPPQATDAEGRFQLTLDAPAEYVFLVFVGKTAVVTPLPNDPARTRLSLVPGERRDGVVLTLLSSERGKYVEPLAKEPTPPASMP